MPGMGPPPNPNARRRNVRPETTSLPAAGYDGPVPDWPIGVPDVDEIDIWQDLWRKPQAAAWAKMSAERTVARYCRALVQAEQRDAKPQVLSEVRQLEDRLGLTPMAMLRLRWVIAKDEVAEARGAKKADRPRLRAVEGG